MVFYYSYSCFCYSSSVPCIDQWSSITPVVAFIACIFILHRLSLFPIFIYNPSTLSLSLYGSSIYVSFPLAFSDLPLSAPVLLILLPSSFFPSSPSKYPSTLPKLLEESSGPVFTVGISLGARQGVQPPQRLYSRTGSDRLKSFFSCLSS